MQLHWEITPISLAHVPFPFAHFSLFPLTIIDQKSIIALLSPVSQSSKSLNLRVVLGKNLTQVASEVGFAMMTLPKAL